MAQHGLEAEQVDKESKKSDSEDSELKRIARNLIEDHFRGFTEELRKLESEHSGFNRTVRLLEDHLRRVVEEVGNSESGDAEFKRTKVLLETRYPYAGEGEEDYRETKKLGSEFTLLLWFIKDYLRHTKEESSTVQRRYSAQASVAPKEIEPGYYRRTPPDLRPTREFIEEVSRGSPNSGLEESCRELVRLYDLVLENSEETQKASEREVEAK